MNEDWLRTGNGEMFIEMSRDEEIAAFVGKTLSTESDTFKSVLFLCFLDSANRIGKFLNVWLWI